MVGGSALFRVLFGKKKIILTLALLALLFALPSAMPRFYIYLFTLIFGLTDSMGILLWPQFAIVFPYVAVVIVLLFRPKGLLKSTW